MNSTPRRVTRWAWFALAMVLLILGAVSWAILQQNFNEDLTQARTSSERELRAIAAFLASELQAGRYQNLERLLRDWGKSEANIARLQLVAANGFVLAAYQRAGEPEQPLSLEQPISYSYQGEATLRLRLDLGEVYRHHQRLVAGLAALFVAVSLLLALLVHLTLKRQHEAARLRRRTQELDATTHALMKSEERLKLALEASNDGMWDWEVQANKVYLSPRWKAMLGYADDELADTFETWEQRLHYEDRPRVLAALQAHLADPTHAYAPEYRLRHKNGAWLWVQSHGRVVVRDAAGQPLRVVGTITDITGRKQAEQALKTSELQLHAIINASPVPKALNDEQQNITYLNPAFIQTFGYTRVDIPTLADWWPKAYPDPEYRQRVADTWQAALDKARQDNTDFTPIEVNVQCKNGTVKTVLASAASIGTAFQGTHLVVLYDITARKHAEAERERLLIELTARNTEMENFVYTISHDLKSPLITIGGFASLLKKDIAKGDTVAMSDSIAEITKGVEQLRMRIEDLLTLSRTGRVVAEMRPVALGQLVYEVVEQFQPRIKELSATVHVANDLPTLVLDRIACARVFTNLIDNALKYRRKQIKLLVEIGWQRRENEVCLYVRDNGGGIKNVYQQRIFDLFQRADSETEGAGVGLAISKRIIDVHGGRLWVESEPGVGSTFWIGLPLAALVENEGNAV